MRRSFSGLVLGLALLVGSLSWAGFVLTETVLDPSRSEAFADQVVSNGRLRSALTSRLADGLSDTVPFDAPVPRQALEAAAGDALDEPGIAAELKRAIVEVHQNALNGVEENVTLDASALGLAARNQLVGDRPELDGRVPESPEITVELPTSGLSFLGTIRDGVAAFTLYSAAAAGAAALLALLLAKDRPRILRRVAFWAFGTAAFWLVVGIGIPVLADLLAPSSAALIAGAIDVFFGSMVLPAIVMAGVGAGLLVVSALWPGMARRRPSRAIHARPVTAPDVPLVTAQPTPAKRGSNVRDRGAQISPGVGSRVAGSPGAGSPAAGPATPNESRPVVAPAPDPTHIMPVDMPSIDPIDGSPDVSDDAEDFRPAPAWRPGIGYIDQH